MSIQVGPEQQLPPITIPVKKPRAPLSEQAKEVRRKNAEKARNAKKQKAIERQTLALQSPLAVEKPVPVAVPDPVEEQEEQPAHLPAGYTRYEDLPAPRAKKPKNKKDKKKKNELYIQDQISKAIKQYEKERKTKNKMKRLESLVGEQGDQISRLVNNPATSESEQAPPQHPTKIMRPKNIGGRTAYEVCRLKEQMGKN